jgi:uncharacterized protein YidB (DUF937 family)
VQLLEKLTVLAEPLSSSASWVDSSRRAVVCRVLANKFAQSGQGNAFQSWVGMGENEAISSNQVQNALGSEQVKALAAKMGVDPAQASSFLADYLPKIVDKLTPQGKVDPTADDQQGLAALLPSLLQSLTGQSPGGGPGAHNITARSVGPPAAPPPFADAEFTPMGWRMASSSV